MLSRFFTDLPPKYFLAGWAIMLGPLILLFILAKLFVWEVPTSKAEIVGCYIADNAPALDVQLDAIHILDGSDRTLTFSRGAGNLGQRLLVEPALRLEPQGDGSFAFETGIGIGYFWPLVKGSRDDPRNLRTRDKFAGMISMLAGNAQQIVYVRTDTENACS